MLALTFFCVVSSLAATCLCDAMAMIPGNNRLQRHLEYRLLCTCLIVFSETQNEMVLVVV